jgi:NDP-sugar pyrophosphorylase family protein
VIRTITMKKRKEDRIMTEPLHKARQLLDRWLDQGRSKDLLEARNIILREEQKIINKIKEKTSKDFIIISDKNLNKGSGGSAPPSVPCLPSIDVRG